MSDSPCPSREILTGCLRGTLPEDQARKVLDHIGSCPDCRAALETVNRETGDTLTSDLKDPGIPDPCQGEPQREAAIDRAKALPASADTISCAGSGASPGGPAAPTELGPYEIVDKLGEGGMGTVYKAWHKNLRRHEALKLLPHDRTQPPDAVARFRREMGAVGNLDHPHIVRATGAGEFGRIHFLAMEFVDGISVSDLVREVGKLPIPDACEIIRQTACALQYAHDRRCIHRDVKPSNLMLARVKGPEPGFDSRHALDSRPSALDPFVKVLDFGLALLQGDRTEEQNVTATNHAMGTADYMSPEQTNNAHNVDARTDIYSLGCTFYKLLTGRAPFSGDEYQGYLDKMIAHRQDDPPPVGQLRNDIPKELATIIHRMMAKTPDRRPQTPGDVATAVGRFAKGSNLSALLTAATSPSGSGDGADQSMPGTAPYLSSALKDTTPSRLRKPAAEPRRRRAVVITALALAPLFLIALGVVIWINGTRIEVPDKSRVRVDEEGVHIETPNSGEDSGKVAVPSIGPLSRNVEEITPRTDEGGGASGNGPVRNVSTAQEMQVLFRIDGELPDCRFGSTAATVGDLNADGIPDFVVGASRAAPDGQTNQGSLFVVSGKDGSFLRRVDGTTAHANLGSWVDSAGDVDGDGFVDILATSPNANVDGVREAGALFVFSGKNGSVLHQFSGRDAFVQWGNQAAAAGDVNRDGTPDVIAGTIRHHRDTGCVTVYSGRDGTVLHEFYGTASGNIFGHGVDGAGDVNGDGKADLIVGAPGGPGPGTAKVFSGADGSVLFTFTGERNGDALGQRVCGQRDLNGDGTPDFVVSAVGANQGELGIVSAYCGTDGSILWRITGKDDRERLGFLALRAIPDVNGDGKDEVMVGSWSTPRPNVTRSGGPQSAGAPGSGTAQGGRAHLLSGADGSLLAYYDEKVAAAHVDVVDYLGDVNGDGQPDFLVGAGCVDCSDNGHVCVVTVKTSELGGTD